LLVAGCWLLVAGFWLLVAGCWLLVAGLSCSMGSKSSSGAKRHPELDFISRVHVVPGGVNLDQSFSIFFNLVRVLITDKKIIKKFYSQGNI
jgi:hypothetical protein